MTALLMSVALLLTCVTASQGTFAFAPAKNYPNLGLLLPNLVQAKSDPLPMPYAEAYLLLSGPTLTWEDRFKPFELWYHDQCCGRWQDASGNRLVLGRATHRLPAFAATSITRDHFALRLTQSDTRLNPRDRSQVDEWIATFADTPVYPPEIVKLNTFALDEIRYYPSDAPDKLVYALLPRRIGNSRQADWFCVTLHAPGSHNHMALREYFETAFLVEIRQLSRISQHNGVSGTHLSLPRRDNQTPDLPHHPVRLAARKSVENYEDWWLAETRGYTILSDADTELGKALIHELQDTLPLLLSAFTALVPPLTRSGEIALLRLFRNRADYVNYVGSSLAWSGGMWISGRRELVLHLENEPRDLMRILRHEAFHQYLSYAYAMIPAAAWFNEGHACLFESTHIDGRGQLLIDEEPARVDLLLDHLDEVTLRLPMLLEASYEEFYAGSARERGLKYAMAWGLVYYLQKGAPLERNTPFQSLLSDYAVALDKTRDSAEATIRAFADKDMTLFLANFREFWLKRRGTAAQYDPLNP